MVNPVSAVIFDMDGVLIDTEPVWDEVRRGLAAEEGRAWPDGATTAMQGLSTPEWARYLAEVVGIEGEAARIAEKVIGRQIRHYRTHGLPVLPGAPEAVERMAHRPGTVIGLASSSPRRVIDAVLAELGVADLFSATVSTEEVPAGKPAPDGYLAACRALGVHPSRAVAIEDSTNGMLSASAAGMGLIAVPRPFNPPAPQAIGAADAVLGSLDELTTGLVDRVLAARG